MYLSMRDFYFVPKNPHIYKALTINKFLFAKKITTHKIDFVI